MRCDPIQKKGMPSFFVLALFGVSPNVDSTCLGLAKPVKGITYMGKIVIDFEEATC